MQLGHNKNRLCIHKHCTLCPCHLQNYYHSVLLTSKYPPLKVGTILNPNVFVSRTKFITLYISVTCAMDAPSILLDNSLTGLVISGLLCLVRYNNVPTPNLYMDCVFSSTFEISSPFSPINPGVPGVIVISFFANLSPNCFSKLLIIVGAPTRVSCHHHSVQFEHLNNLPNLLDLSLENDLAIL